MKNLIIIGNGFDRAHNMRTSYNEFIEDLFGRYFKDKKSYPNILGNCLPQNLNELRNLLKSDLVFYDEDKDSPHRHRAISRRGGNRFNFSNKFLEYLLCFPNKNNWYDIEYSYFEELMRYCDKQYDLSLMHRDFDVLKKYLSDHLIEQEKDVEKIDSYGQFFKSFFRLPNSSDRNLILNFNYTRIIENLYKDVIKYPIVYMHGKLEDEENPMIFGYAANEEEIDKLLSQNNNEFLKNIKKHLYKRTENENVLKAFLEPRKYSIGADGKTGFRKETDVFILGHSCGLSDNLILSEIFNSESIRSVKIFYHDKYDNYLDVQTNIDRISRIGFNKLVSFQKSHRMPQWNDDESLSKDFIEYFKSKRSVN